VGRLNVIVKFTGWQHTSVVVENGFTQTLRLLPWACAWRDQLGGALKVAVS
jgi:hypothetical protein